jgi:hypothetical protein
MRLPRSFEQPAQQQRLGAGSRPDEAMMLLRQPLLDGIEQLALQDGRMLARDGLAAIDHLAEVEAVAQQVGQRAAGERDAAITRPPVSSRRLAPPRRRNSATAPGCQ